MVPVALLLLGILVLLYPVGATYYNNYKQSEFARRYATEVESAGSSTLAEALARAERYNEALQPGLMRDAWDPTDEAQSAAYDDYLSQLDDFGSMARIEIPSIKVDLPIYHGTSDEALDRGVGHLFGSSLPVGGTSTHAVLTGHSALAEATMFDRLPELKVGDRFFVDVYGRKLAYEVDQVKVVLPSEMDDLARVDGEDYITLITCTPYAVNSHRLLVRGHAVPYVADEAPKPGLAGFDWTVQPWMWTRLGGAAAALLLLLAMIAGWIREDRRRRRKARHSKSGRGR